MDGEQTKCSRVKVTGEISVFFPTVACRVTRASLQWRVSLIQSRRSYCEWCRHLQTFGSGIKWRTVGQKHILEVRNDALDHCIAAGMSLGFLACRSFLSVSLCIWGLGMWPEQQVDLKQYKWRCLSKALHPLRSLKCLGERMAAHRVPVCLLPWLGVACFALLCGRTVNLGCVEAGEVSWEIFKDYIIAWEKEL